MKKFNKKNFLMEFYKNVIILAMGVTINAKINAMQRLVKSIKSSAKKLIGRVI